MNLTHFVIDDSRCRPVDGKAKGDIRYPVRAITFLPLHKHAPVNHVHPDEVQISIFVYMPTIENQGK